MSMFKFTVACCALLATAAQAVPATLKPRTQCYSGVYTILARGSVEVQGQSDAEEVVSAINAAIPNSGSEEVVYPASEGSAFWTSLGEGIANAQQEMQAYYEACPDGKMVVMGYSQGALVMSGALAGTNLSGPYQPLATEVGNNIAAVIQFGDPSRNPGQGYAAEGASACMGSSPLERTGHTYTAMEPYSSRLEDWCLAEDPVCCNGGTDVDDHFSYWTSDIANAVVSFVQSQLGESPTAGSSSTASSTSASSSSTSTSIPASIYIPLASSTVTAQSSVTAPAVASTLPGIITSGATGSITSSATGAASGAATSSPAQGSKSAASSSTHSGAAAASGTHGATTASSGLSSSSSSTTASPSEFTGKASTSGASAMLYCIAALFMTGVFYSS